MTKRENDIFSMEDLIKTFINKNNLTKGISQLKAEEAWSKTMSASVSIYTTSVQLKNETLIVKLKSSVLKEELSYGKNKIIKILNEELKENLITKLIFI